MQIVDARDRRVLAAAREHAVAESGWLAVHLALSALTLWIAMHGLAGVAPGALWFLAGAVAVETFNAVRSTAVAWRELRRLGRAARGDRRWSGEGRWVAAAAVERARVAAGGRGADRALWLVPRGLLARPRRGRLVLWVGDQDMSQTHPGVWPLAKHGRTDLFPARAVRP